VESDEQWDALCRVVGDPELSREEYRDVIERRRHAAAIDERISAWTKERTPIEATEALQAAGVPSGPSSSAADLLAQPQLRARGFFVALELPELGAAIEHPAFFARSEPGGIGIRRRAPRVGEHNAAVYAEIGVGAAELAELARRGVV
jgi:crotonobetainyl-CoA:carnitine CoA-transferase CaiB-like acyl-CoA transferase